MLIHAFEGAAATLSCLGAGKALHAVMLEPQKGMHAARHVAQQAPPSCHSLLPILCLAVTLRARQLTCNAQAHDVITHLLSKTLTAGLWGCHGSGPRRLQ